MNNDPLVGRVAAWLGEQGYPLEMAVAAAFEEQGFRIIQSDYYEDPESGDQREIDVMAFRQKSTGKTIARLALMIECKASRDKPWVVFTSASIKYADRARIVQRASSRKGRHFLEAVCDLPEVRRLALFALPTRPAYGVTQAMTTKADVAYAACMSAGKAVAGHAIVDAAYDERGWRMVDVLLPIVIIDGRLFEAYLGEHGRPVVEEVQTACLAWRHALVGPPTTFITISTVEHLPALALAARAAADTLLSLDRQIKAAASKD
jgi:hypothetical protein